MKKTILLCISIISSVLLFATSPTTISVTSSAGGLSTAVTTAGGDLTTVTNLTITGTIDATDFKTMRDAMPLLAVLDLSGTTIAAGTKIAGTYGTNNYPANEIPKYAFCTSTSGVGKTSLKSIAMPASLTSIGDLAFLNCNGLTGSLTILSSVISIGYGAFQSCSGFTGSLVIPSSVIFIGDTAFLGSGFTGSLTIPSSVTSIGAGALPGKCLITVDIANPNYSGTDGVLFNKNQTILMQCPTTKTGSFTIPSSVTSIGQFAFLGCSGFTGSLTIPSSVTSIGDTAFSGCSGFTGSLTIPSSVTTIGALVFGNCSGFTGSLTIPSTVTSIESYAFYGCSGFTGSLTIPSSVTSIGDQAFLGCAKISSIKAYGTAPGLITLGSYVFSGIPTSTCVLNVPVGTIGLYAAAAQWSAFTTKADVLIVPTLSTQAVSPVGLTTATGNGTISGLGENNPMQYGVVWSTATNPTVALSTKTTQGAASVTGTFTSDITGLTGNTKYYLKAYLTNSTGTYYGNEVTFKTLAPNTAPTNISLSVSTINENVAANSIVGTLNSSDPDAGNTFTYILVAGSGSTDNASFNINGTSLSITGSPDFETKSSYTVRVRTTDQGGLYTEKAFTISINNVNEAPTDITLSVSAINENVADNSTVGTLGSIDPDASNTFTYTLVSGTGDTDNAAFNFNGNSLRITSSPDFETKSSYTVRVRTTDQGGLYFEKVFTISINDINEAPGDINLSASTINENVSANSIVGALSSTDPDDADTFTYSLVSGTGSTDNASFTINGSSLLINNSPDFETKSSYTILVCTTDQGGLYFEKAFVITINDVNEVPAMEITSTSGTTIPTNYYSLKRAFDKINDGTHRGDITIKLFANTTETASAVLNASGTGSASYSSVDIYPTASGLSISGKLEAPLIDLNGATHVTINGSLNGGNAGKDLTIVNTNASATEGTSTIRFINDASSDTVTNCTIKGSSLDTGAGVLFFAETTGTTGNSHIIIENNDITNSDDAHRPVNAIYSYGTESIQNIANEIRHNNIFDFMNRDEDSYGISLDGNSSFWTINGNSLYETTAFALTGDANNIAINIYSNSVDSFMVSDNFIGGSAAACSGIMSLSSMGRFKGISLEVGSIAASSVQNNTIKGINFTSVEPDVVGINSRGNVNITGNIIGAAEGTGSITINSGDELSDLTFAGITNDDLGSVENNTIGSISFNPLNGNGFVSFFGIISSGKSVSNNVIGSKLTPNSVNVTSANFIICGIDIEGSDNILISGNTIANLTQTSVDATANSMGAVIGIICASVMDTITNNTIRDLSGSNTDAIDAGLPIASATGIIQINEDPGHMTSGNTISDLSNTNPAFKGDIVGIDYYGGTGVKSRSSKGNIPGINYSGGTDGTNQVSGNFIQNLSVHTNSTDATIYGIKIEDGTATYTNNIVSLSGNTSSNIYGISDNGQADNLYFNTVQIGGTLSTGATNKSYALFSTDKASIKKLPAANAQKIQSDFTNLLTSKLSKFQQAKKQSMQLVKSAVASDNTRDFKNNIFNNTRSTAGGTGLHYAAGFSYADITSKENLTLDYNDYRATGAGGVLGNYNGTDQPVLPIVTANDNHSISLNPMFKNSTGANAKDYFPLATSLAGIPLTDVTTDFAGINRNVTVPTMGAYEYVETLPTVTTLLVTAIETFTATGNGTITELGVPYPTNYGICWNTTGTPTTLDSKTDKGVATISGAFTAAMTGLKENTTYYIRAYATNSVDTGYGEEVTFKTAGAAGLDDLMNQQITVYPNPVTDAFQLKGLTGVTSISMIDVSGRILIQKQISENESVSVSTLLKGVYVLKIKNNKGTAERKVVKK